jgi:hypothetical protein
LLANGDANRGSSRALRLAMRQPPELVGRAYRFSLAALRFYRKLPKSPDAQVPGVQFYKAALNLSPSWELQSKNPMKLWAG